MGWLTRVALCVLATTIFPACGGSSKGGDDDDSEAGSCDNAAACGGDVIGVWMISSSCLEADEEEAAVGAGCPGATGRATNLEVSGDIAFLSDLTYTATTILRSDVVVNLPASCLMRQGVTVSCAQLQDSLESSLSGSPYSSARCSVSAGSGCACTLSLMPIASTASGTYTTTAEGVLTQTESGGPSSNSVFCVEGSTMTLSPEEMSMGNVTGSITLTKQ